VGLIPVWGIVPKVGIAYSGTYVVGIAVLQWYLTGRHLTRQQMRELSAQAFTRGKVIAQNLVKRLPRPRIRQRKEAQLPEPAPGEKTQPKGWLKRLPRPRIGKRKETALPATFQGKVCPSCGKPSAADAAFCQYCGRKLEESPVAEVA
jgi:hypothetical protein